MVMFEKHDLSAGLRGFLLLLCEPFLSCFGLFFCWFFLFFFHVISSCCCLINQVSMFWFWFLLFWVSLVMLCVIFWSFLFVFGSCLCCGGFKGQVRWPKGPPHLALNPPYLFSLDLDFGLFFVCFVCFCWFCFFFVLLFAFLEGFKGQVRLPEGPPHLAINPPY